MQTRKEVEAYCKANGIELSVEKWPCSTHVHVNIDAPRKVFRAEGLHNLGLWDDVRSPNWKIVGRDLAAADFGDCTDPDCEYCEGDE